MKASLLPCQRLVRLHYIWLATFCLVASGCRADVTLWQYAPDSYSVVDKPLTQKRLLVPPFKDSRSDSNIDASMWGLILPVGWLDYSLPEGLFIKVPKGVSRESWPGWPDSSQFKPKGIFARAAAEELNASGLFKEAVFVPHRSEGELVLYGEVLSTRHQVTVVTYGVSFLAPVLWLIGFPAGTISDELEIEFQLEDRVTGVVLWHKKYQDRYKATGWIYSGPTRPFNYDTLYKTMLRDVVESLRAELTSSTSGKPDH